MMKKLVYSLIASLCLVGCSEDMNEMPQKGLAQQGSVKTLTATVGETESRTSLGADGKTVLWSATDAIALTDGTTWAEYTLTDGAGEASATFQATDATVPEAGTYYAYYPAENVTAVSGGTFTVTLPATQTYTAGSFAPDALPMMAVSTSTNFEFKHVCGLLKLTLQNFGNHKLNLSKVIVSANEPMSGTATVTCEGNPEARLTEGGAVTVAFSEPLALDVGERVVVYVALPVKGYTNAKISVITADDKYRTFSGAVDRRFSIQRAQFSKVDLNLKSEEMTALPEMSARDLKRSLTDAVISAGEEISSVKSIVFQPNETINSSSGCEIDYDNATKTATVKFAAPIVKLDADATYMFSGMTSLESVDLSCFDTSKVTNMSRMFLGCQDLTSITFGNNFDTGKVTDMSLMFYGCMALTSLDLSNFDTTEVTNMSYMFFGCQDLTSITFGNNFDTGKVTDMSSMFNGCMALTSLDLSNFDTANVTYMSRMFSDCSGLTSLDLSNFDTSKVTDMSAMFNRCSGLTSITFGNNFDTGKVTDMSAMFNGCIALTSLDLSNFDTGKVTDMSYMFYYCLDLTSLNLSSFTTDALTGYSTAFTNVPADCAITISSALNEKVGDQLTSHTNVTVVTVP